MIGMHTFGASAPLKDLQKKFGFTPEAVAARAASRWNEAAHEAEPADGPRRGGAGSARRLGGERQGRAAVGGRRDAVDRADEADGSAGSDRASQLSTSTSCAASRPRRQAPASRTCCCSAWAARAWRPRCCASPSARARRIPSCTCSTRPIRRRCARSERESSTSRARSSSSRASRARRSSRTSSRSTSSSACRTRSAPDEAGEPLHRDHRSRLEAREVARRGRLPPRSLHGVKSIGGRYSALSNFGMVPGAVDGRRRARAARARASAMAHACAPVRAGAATTRARARARSSASARNAGATSSRSSPRRRSTTSAPGSSSCSPSPPASRARA